MKFYFSYVYGSKDEYNLGNIILEEGDDRSEVVIPDSYNGKPITQISDVILYEFGSELKTVVFGDNVSVLPITLFYESSGLEKIYLGKKIGTIQSELEWCPNLKDVYFNGTQEEWEALSEYGTPQRFANANCTVHFGTMYDKVQLNQDDKPIYPFTHWDCVKGVPNDIGVQSDYTETDETKASFIKNKPMTDTEVIENSENLITSGAVFKAINEIEVSGGTGEITDNSIVTEMLADGAVTDAKLSKKYATEEYVDEALSFEKIDLPEDFENYTDVIHLSEPLPRDWSSVKIWSAEDSLAVPENQNPYNFDFSQISETNYATISAIPSKIDLSLLDGKTVASSMLFEISVGEFSGMFGIQLFKIDSLFQLAFFSSSWNLQYLQEGGTTSGIDDFVAPAEGWYVTNHSTGTATEATEEDLSVLSGIYDTVKILDWMSFFSDDASEMGVSDISPEMLLELFLKNMISISYAPGYYVTKKAAIKTPEKGVDYFTEEDKSELVNAVLAALPTWEGGSY